MRGTFLNFNSTNQESYSLEFEGIKPVDFSIGLK
jgi:hypothetical protein